MAFAAFTSGDRFTLARNYAGCSNFTAAVWVKPLTSRHASQLCIWEDSAPDYQFLISRDPGNGGIIATGTRASGVAILSGGSMTLGAWNHICIRLSNGATLDYLLGGTVISSKAADVLGNITSVGRIGIGSRQDGNYPEDGSLAEAAIWTRSLTNLEILALSKGISPRRFPNGLDQYVPLIRNKSSVCGSPLVTIGSPIVSNHPRIYQ